MPDPDPASMSDEQLISWLGEHGWPNIEKLEKQARKRKSTSTQEPSPETKPAPDDAGTTAQSVDTNSLLYFWELVRRTGDYMKPIVTARKYRPVWKVFPDLEPDGLQTDRIFKLYVSLKNRLFVQGKKPYSHWVATVAHNFMVDQVRRSARQVGRIVRRDRTNPVESPRERAEAHLIERAEAQKVGDPDAAISRDEVFETYDGCLASLSHDDARLVVLKIEYRLDNEAIYHLYPGVKEGTVRQRMMRALQKLRDCLEAKGISAEGISDGDET